MKNNGFTLVELLAVIAILAILVIIALPNVLKMFNDSKKNSFLTEAKTVYSEVSKKYKSESMKGNKLTYVSSEDDTKLDMTGKSLKYCVLLNADGSVKSMKVSNGEWIAELPSGKKITDLNSSDLKDVPSGYKFECKAPLPAKSFDKDSWEVIASNAKSCTDNPDSCPYSVGNEKEVDLGTYGKHKVRIANLKAPTEEGCGTEGFSESACGFVVEFTDIIAAHVMNPTGNYNGKTYQYGWNKDGWPASAMYKFLNDESDSSSIINLLPKKLKNVIKPTITVSGRGGEDTVEYFTSPEDKLYLLAPKEIYSDWSDKYDSAADLTRQLDYYKIKGVTTDSYTSAIKKNSEGNVAWWWLRSAGSSSINGFYSVVPAGYGCISGAYSTLSVSPAFRIG